MNQILYNENKRAITNLVLSEDTASRPNKEILTEPNIFLRKWIGEVIFEEK